MTAVALRCVQLRRCCGGRAYERVLLAVDARRHACCCAQCECCCSRDARGAVRATAAVVKVGIDNSGAEIATAAAREGRGVSVCRSAARRTRWQGHTPGHGPTHQSGGGRVQCSHVSHNSGLN